MTLSDGERLQEIRIREIRRKHGTGHRAGGPRAGFASNPSFIRWCDVCDEALPCSGNFLLGIIDRQTVELEQTKLLWAACSAVGQARETENARLRAALEASPEWVVSLVAGGILVKCWSCSVPKWTDHAPNCQRQQALGLTEGETP